MLISLLPTNLQEKIINKQFADFTFYLLRVIVLFQIIGIDRIEVFNIDE